MEPLFLKGVLQEKIWGGYKLASEFGYNIPSAHTGEYWAISAHSNGTATVINGEFKGLKLDELWLNHRELFGNQKGDVFPLLVKIIDAKEDLSVQVHPNDNYGLKYEGELGKTECWYILSADPGSKIVYGHNAETKKELKQRIKENDWNKLLNYIEVKSGDFFYLPSGTIHALGKGIMVLEIQQSSDTTYRVYDYNRQNPDGSFRDLHIEKAIDVTTVPHVKKEKKRRADKNKLIETEFFTVFEWNITKLTNFEQNSLYTLISVIDGEGKLILEDNIYTIKKGNHFILPYQIKKWKLDGKLHLICSHP